MKTISKEKQEGRPAEKFLDEVFEWKEKELPWSLKEDWYWGINADGSLVNMMTISLTLKLQKAGFIDSTTTIRETPFKWEKNGTGIEALKKKLEGKSIVSLNRDGDWFLKVV